MDKKTFTFLVTSNRKGSTKAYTVSAGWLNAFFFVGLVTVVVLSAVLVDYAGLLLQEGENKRLKAENIQLTRQFDVVESKVLSLEGSLDRIKSMTTKIKLITDIESKDRSLELVMGAQKKKGQPLLGEDMDLDERIPANQSSHMDSVFFGKSALNTEEGELARYVHRNYASLSVKVDQGLRSSKLVELGLLQLKDLLKGKHDLISSTPNMQPVKGWISARFGYRVDPLTGRPSMNNGIDFAAPPGTSVLAPADGNVALVTYDSLLGKIVEIDHGYGVRTRYAHNSQIFVEVGQKVKRKETIAAVGNTGKTSNPILHYQVHVHGVPVDPAIYILNK